MKGSRLRAIRSLLAGTLIPVAVIAAAGSIVMWWGAAVTTATRTEFPRIVDATIGARVDTRLRSLTPKFITALDAALAPRVITRTEDASPGLRARLIATISSPAVAAVIDTIPGLRAELRSVLSGRATTVEAVSSAADNSELAAKLTDLERHLSPTIWGRATIVSAGRRDLS